jgi:hypothetical protein
LGLLAFWLPDPHADFGFSILDFRLLATAPLRFPVSGLLAPAGAPLRVPHSRELSPPGSWLPDSSLLLTGDKGKSTQPVTLTREHNGGRIVYAPLGVPEDFKDDNFRAPQICRRFADSGIFTAAAQAAKREEA